MNFTAVPDFGVQSGAVDGDCVRADSECFLCMLLQPVGMCRTVFTVPELDTLHVCFRTLHQLNHKPA